MSIAHRLLKVLRLKNTECDCDNPYERDYPQIETDDNWQERVKQANLERSQLPLKKYKVMENGDIFMAHEVHTYDGVVQFVVYTETGQEAVAVINPWATIVLQKEIDLNA